ncbi:unnamed protein product [Ranitomeya imitator]|uniref:Ig-like domain-containing protein n=1 Tax=Ranitomeya imitator TaxID=111125 RepID=A0ABN9L4U2_9NEOB|nr:unnamed protein product [Ranitomeya imitator]
MVGFPMPAGLNESMSLAIQIGRRLRERKSVHHLAVLSESAALNLMDLDYAKRCGFFLEPLRCPIPLRGIDATPLAKNKPQYWAQLTMCMAPAHQEVIRFLVEVDASEIGAGAVLSQRGKPQMSAPIEFTVADSFHVRYSLNLQKFYPKDIKISWCREDKSDKYVISAMETIHAGTRISLNEVFSVVRISKYLFRDPEMKIIVEWKHERTETSERRSLSVRDFPGVHTLDLSVSPMLEDGKAAALTCHISGYFPDLLSVNWFTKKDGNVTNCPEHQQMQT